MEKIRRNKKLEFELTLAAKTNSRDTGVDYRFKITTGVGLKLGQCLLQNGALVLAPTLRQMNG